MTDIGYKPGNTSDTFKHGNLETLMRCAGLESLRYVELHSGEGSYAIATPSGPKEYAGSAVRALRIASERSIPYKAYLHEIRPDARARLAKNTDEFPDVTVRGDWRKHIAGHVKEADKETLFVIDPCTTDDYYCEDRAIGLNLVAWIALMLRKESGVFAYFPQRHVRSDERLLGKMHQIIRDSGQDGVDLCHAVRDTTGRTCRYDHNLVVAHQPVLNPVINNHFLLGRNLGLQVSATILLPTRGA